MDDHRLDVNKRIGSNITPQPGGSRDRRPARNLGRRRARHLLRQLNRYRWEMLGSGRTDPSRDCSGNEVIIVAALGFGPARGRGDSDSFLMAFMVLKGIGTLNK
jgi:hypothetical protein